MASFLAELDKNDDIRHQCELLLTVSISRFFRDRGFWQGFKENILPEIMDVDREKIKFWSAGCACGEEVYSFKIIWNLLRDSYLHVPDLEVLATDINPITLDRARSGIYPFSSLKEVTTEIRSRYFKQKGSKQLFEVKAQKGSKQLFEVKASLKKGITWTSHHLLSDPPGSDFDIVFLRNNVLTYYENQLKKRAFSNVLESLAPRGILVLGSHETIPFETSDLVGVEPYPFVFKKSGR